MNRNKPRIGTTKFRSTVSHVLLPVGISKWSTTNRVTYFVSSCDVSGIIPYRTIFRTLLTLTLIFTFGSDISAKTLLKFFDARVFDARDFLDFDTSVGAKFLFDVKLFGVFLIGVGAHKFVFFAEIVLAFAEFVLAGFRNWFRFQLCNLQYCKVTLLLTSLLSFLI